MKLIDLTHTFTDKMPAYPGDPDPSLTQAASIGKEGYTDHLLHTLMHVGTHMDAPLHMIEGGKKMDQISIDKFTGKGVLVDARGKKNVDADLVENMHIEPGSIVLILTGQSSHYRTEKYFKDYPHLTEAFGRKMVELKVKIVGMDILSPDEPEFPVHKILLGNEVLIIENLTNLDQLVGVKDFEVMAFPVKLNADAAPVRVVAKINE